MFLRKFLIGIQPFRCKYTFARICDITDKRLGETLTVKGWIKANRQMKKYSFIDVSDGSTHTNLQIVLDKKLTENAANIGYGASVVASGKLSQTPKGQLELQAENIELIGTCPTPSEGYPFASGQIYAPEHIRKYLHLRTQVDSVCSMLRVRHHATKAVHDYFDKIGFFQTQAPVLTSNDCEGAGEIFVVKPESEALRRSMKKETVPLDEAFFDQKAYLAVSGQLHLEAMVNHLGSVYSFGPTFRAENSISPNHLAEFTMVEAEEAFVETTEQLATRIDHMVKSITTQLLNKAEADIQRANGKVEPTASRFDWLNREFHRLTYAEVGKILTENNDKLKNRFDATKGLNREQELFLVNYCQAPLFVIDWPKQIKPFYMRASKQNPDVVEALDFLVPFVGELAGGSLREDDYDRLKAKLPSDDLDWYLDLRLYGGCRSAGFGLGFERYLQLITGISSIKDVIPFPRWPHNCSL